MCASRAPGAWRSAPRAAHHSWSRPRRSAWCGHPPHWGSRWGRRPPDKAHKTQPQDDESRNPAELSKTPHSGTPSCWSVLVVTRLPPWQPLRSWWCPGRCPPPSHQGPLPRAQRPARTRRGGGMQHPALSLRPQLCWPGSSAVWTLPRHLRPWPPPRPR